jgi:hypothetical protein
MMKENTKCEAFQERLDLLGGRPPTEDETRELEQHAAGCTDCATMLEAYMHLAGPSNEELEAQVPDEMTDAMWHRVAAQTVDRGKAPGIGRISLFRILVPTLAAAVVVLVFALGFMLGELRHLRGVEARMAAELERRDVTITALQMGRDDTPGLLASERFRNIVRRKFLEDRDVYRVSELIALLEQLPPDTRLLNAREMDALLSGGGGSSLSPYNSRLRSVDYSNGLDAREAIMLIEILGIDPDELVTRERFTALNGI